MTSTWNERTEDVILTTRDDQSMTDEDRTFRAWIDPSTSYSATAVMYVDGDPGFPACLIRTRDDRTWWLPCRLFEWPTVTRPWPTKWSWAAGTTSIGQRWMVTGDRSVVSLGWDGYEGVVDRWDSVVAVADRATIDAASRDDVIDRLTTFRADEMTFTELCSSADELIARRDVPIDVYSALVEVTRHLDGPSDTGAFVDRVIDLVT